MEDFQGNGNMTANEVLGDILGNLLLVILCEDSSICERLVSIETPVATKVEFLLPAVYFCQRDLSQQGNGQESLRNYGISEPLENRFVDLRMEVVLRVGLAAIRDQGRWQPRGPMDVDNFLEFRIRFHILKLVHRDWVTHFL
jgi:hypothetical protein